MLMLGFNVPALNTSDNVTEIHALRLISALLGGGESAVLPARLERQQELVAGASSWFNPLCPGRQPVHAVGYPNIQKGITLDQVEQALWQQLQALQETPPDAAELGRVRAQLIASEVYARDSITRRPAASACWKPSACPGACWIATLTA